MKHQKKAIDFLKKIYGSEVKEANIVESDAEDWEIYERKGGQEISRKSSIRLIRQCEKIFHQKFNRVDRFLDLGCGGVIYSRI